MEVNNADDRGSAEGSLDTPVTVLGDDEQINKPAKGLKKQLLLSDYSCRVCGEIFSSMAQLAKHIQFHDRGRPFPCTVCGKRFLSRSHYHEHQRVHTGERPYPCDRCDSTFTTHHNLKRHQMTHDKSEPYRCTVCGELFCQVHQIGDLSSVLGILKQCDVTEPENVLELEQKMLLKQDFQDGLEFKHKKKKKRKHKRVCLDKDRSPSAEGHPSRMPSNSTVPGVHKKKVVDGPEILHQMGYRVQTVAYDIEITL